MSCLFLQNWPSTSSSTVIREDHCWMAIPTFRRYKGSHPHGVSDLQGGLELAVFKWYRSKSKRPWCFFGPNDLCYRVSRVFRAQKKRGHHVWTCLDLGSLAARTCKQRMGSTKLKSTWQCRSNLGSTAGRAAFFSFIFMSGMWFYCIWYGLYIWYMYMCHGHNDISTYNYIYLFDMYLFMYNHHE